MIIKREYVTFGYLVNSGDPAGKLFIECLHESFPEERWEELFNVFYSLCLYQREMSWAFERLDKIIDGFNKLDMEQPFDNGLSYADVKDIDIVWKDEDSIKLHLISNIDGYRHIINVVELFSNQE